VDNITQEFWNYHQKNKKIKPEQKQYNLQKDKTLETVIENWCIYREKIENRDPDTIGPQRRKIKQIFRELGIDIKKTTLEKFYNKYGKSKGITKLLNNYKNFHINRYNNKSIPLSEKLEWNSISNMITPLNPFFEKYLGLKVHISNPGKKRTYQPRTKLHEINKILDYIDDKWSLKIKLASNERKKIEYRKRWAVERISVSALKYLWTRGKAITEGYLTIADINHMKKHGRIPLHIRKRLNNPEVFQQPVVPDEFIQEWTLYEKYRDSNDYSPNAPAIVQINKQGKAITRKWLRGKVKDYRRELDLPEYITPHNIRRSMHTLCRAVTPNRMIAQVQLGDVSHKIADEHYNIPDTDMIKDELNKMYLCDSLPGETKTRIENSKNKPNENRGYA